MNFDTTQRADLDITEIYVRGAADFGVEQAERYLQGLIAMFERLARNPHISRARMEFNPPVRLHPYRAHMIVYTSRGEGVLIVRVLHGREDWERCLL